MLDSLKLLPIQHGHYQATSPPPELYGESTLCKRENLCHMWQYIPCHTTFEFRSAQATAFSFANAIVFATWPHTHAPTTYSKGHYRSPPPQKKASTSSANPISTWAKVIPQCHPIQSNARERHTTYHASKGREMTFYRGSYETKILTFCIDDVAVKVASSIYKAYINRS